MRAEYGIIRDARRSDAADIAILDDMAGNGISMWFWQGAVKFGKAEHALAWGRSYMMSDEEPNGWRNCRIAEVDEVVAANLTGYELAGLDLDPNQAEPLLVPIYELMNAAEGAWYVDSLAVYPENRQMGLAARLLEDATNRAKQCGCSRIALIVRSDNDRAAAMYEKYGYSKIGERDYVGFDARIVPGRKHVLMESRI